MCDWITEKSEKLEMDDLAKDLTTVKALQRKHKGIERELAPIKDKVSFWGPVRGFDSNRLFPSIAVNDLITL